MEDELRKEELPRMHEWRRRMKKEERPRMHKWNTNGTRMEHEWKKGHECTNGTRMEDEWNTNGRRMEHEWKKGDAKYKIYSSLIRAFVAILLS